MPSQPLSLKGRALKLLAAREHSRAELQRKLQPLEESPGQIARLLDELQARGFLDEQRVVDALLHRRAPRLGSARVRQELLARGLPAAAVQQATADLRSTELARARAVWDKKFGQPAADAAGRARQMRFLIARGFAAEAVRRVVHAADDD